MALSYVRCLLLRSTFAATAPRSAVAELGVVRRRSPSPMNESLHSSSSAPPRKDFFRGWGWFAVPVVLNVLFLSMPTFDYGYTSNMMAYFSIPYLAIAAIIGIRRGSHITVTDFLFLAFGDLAIVTLLWHLNPPSRP